MKEALFYKKLKDGLVQCTLCPHFCVVQPGKRGRCGVRENREGTLFSLVYGRLCSSAVDPIEKKPLFHFLPGTKSYSIAAVGCNLACKFCQNWEISQMPKPDKEICGNDVPPAEVVKAALASGCKSISYTYTEPTVFFEYALDTARLAKEKGLKNVLVTNGYINPEPIRMISPYIDAANIDLKAFNEAFYRDLCDASLAPVVDAIVEYKKAGVWIELTTLLIPGRNGSKREIEAIAAFIASIGKSLPWHISAYHPDYLMQSGSPASADAVSCAVSIGKRKGLEFVYAGNIGDSTLESTFCPKCGSLLIERHGFSIRKAGMKGRECKACGRLIELI